MTYLVLVEKLKEFPEDVLTRHRAFLAENRKLGKVIQHGPLLDGWGEAYTLAAEGLEEAESFTDRDPLKQAGDYARYILHPWMLTP
ncbi:MAG: YciI family protein [Firmicutes bacterium]|nr:hypothetical protein [Alicyclobacillaceae bacterium]MCL6497072.1 YciI family protein [Bacillota bacterium]